MASSPPLRTVALGDLHGSLDAFRTILTGAGILEGDAWRGGRVILVQLGDVIDRGPDSVATYEFLADLQVRARKGKGRVVRLLGNHEVSLLEGIYDITDLPDPEALARRISRDVLDKKVQAAFAHRGWLFTHAGLHVNLMQRLRAEMQTSEEGKARFTPRRLAHNLNQRLRQAAAAGEYTDPIFAVGKARGGDDATGGIFWADFDEELRAPARAPRIHQVFGHTPEGYTGARFRRTSDGRRINIDIGIVEDHGGNLGYLEIRGREAVAHYLVGDTEETEPLGRAPLAHRRKAEPGEPEGAGDAGDEEPRAGGAGG
jgi:hypothetical protein